jgi:F-type H+-transporting ATPase subunit alpha
MSTILQDLETQISGLRTTTMKSNVGVVRDCGDGVARIEGLSDVMLNEMIEFPGGLYGIALNLEETEVGAILLGDDKQVTEGTEVRTTGRLLSVPVGKALLGRVIDTLGNPIDGKGPIATTQTYRWRRLPPASSSGNPSASRCRPASWQLTR